VGSADPEHALVCVYIVAEIDVVNFACVSLVHISLSDQSKDVFRGEDTQLCKHSEELALANMAALSDVKVLELGLQMDAAVLHCSAILRDKRLDLVLFLSGEVEVLAAGSEGVILGDRLNNCNGVFVDSLNGKCLINVCYEISILKPCIDAVLSS